MPISSANAGNGRAVLGSECLQPLRLRTMPATWPGIDRNALCEASRVWTVVGLAGKAASASAINRRCRAGRMVISLVQIT
jgi:hypothetical protein